MNFLVEGNYQSSNKDIIDLTLKGNQIQISEIFSVLPVDYSRFLEIILPKEFQILMEVLLVNLTPPNLLIFLYYLTLKMLS